MGRFLLFEGMRAVIICRPMTSSINRKELDSVRILLMVCLLLCLCVTAIKGMGLGAVPPSAADGRADLKSPIGLVFTAALVERQKSDEGASRRLLGPAPPSGLKLALFDSGHIRFHQGLSTPIYRIFRVSGLITRGPPSTQ